MQEKFLKFTTDIKEKWGGLEKQQKIRFSLGVAVLVLAIALTIFFIVRPQWDALMTNSDMTTLRNVEEALEGAGIQSKFADNGRTIMVKKSDMIQAQMVVGTDPTITTSGKFSMEDVFSQGSGLGVSDSVRREMFRLAKANEIAEALVKMDGISDATVILNTPESNGFSFRESEVASATVYIYQNSDINRSQAQSIAESVATAVQGLSKEHVTITNQNMETVFSGENQAAGLPGTDYDLELQKTNQMKYEIYQQLSPMWDDVKVNVNLKLNMDKVVSQETIYSPVDQDTGSGIPTSQYRSSQSAVGNTTGGEPGLGTNDNVTDQYQTGDNTTTSAESSELQTDYAINKQERASEFSVGDVNVDESSIAVLLYKYRGVSQEFMEQENRLGAQSWEEYKLANQEPVPVELDPLIYENIARGTGIPEGRISVLAYEMYYFEDMVRSSVDWQQILLFVILAALILMLAYDLIRRTQPDEVLDVVPELSVEDLLVSTQLEEEKEAEVERLRDIDYTAESEVKKQIDKFVNEKPEAVAQLLRNWLNEGWE